MRARSAPVRMGRARRLLTRALMVLASFALWGPSSAQAMAPTVASGGFNGPSTMDWTGGTVSVYALIYPGDLRVVTVMAYLLGPHDHPQAVLSPCGDFRYCGELTVPPNPDHEQETYLLQFSATDTFGRVSYQGVAYLRLPPAPVDQPPSLSDPLVDPPVVPATAGSVKVGVTATDDHAVSSVVATITKPDGSVFAALDLSAVTPPRFEGTLALPDNTTPNPLSYHVQITATDDVGQSTNLDAGDFTVAAAPPPGTGKLSLAPTWALLGPVRRGSAARTTFTVRNTGAAGTGTVNATAAATGTGFSVVGAGPAGKPLSLAPGQNGVVVVEFRPTRTGTASGRLTITRPDGTQRALVATLSGLGY